MQSNQLLDVEPEEEEKDGAHVDLDSQRKGKCAVIKTSTRQTIFLPVIGLVDADKLKPDDLVGVNKDSYLILDTLPAELVSVPATPRPLFLLFSIFRYTSLFLFIVDRSLSPARSLLPPSHTQV